MNKLSVMFQGVDKIGIFGLGRSNLSLLEMLPRSAVYTLRSDGKIRREDIPGGIAVGGIYEGKHALDNIEEQVLILSPSVRRDRREIIQAAASGVTISSDEEIFFELAEAPVLAVSGSSGKSTTATLAHLMLGGDEAGSRLVGNVGRPMTETLSQQAQMYVAELSSFMLSYHRGTIMRSVLTSITENHLDWHRSFEEYKRAKLSLFALSRECVGYVDCPILAEYCRGRRIYGAVSMTSSLRELVARQRAELYATYENGWLCLNGERIINASELSRAEDYNIANALCAMALTYGLADRERILSTLRGFRGLKHRAEVVFESRGVRYIDSSIDTSAERCAMTLRSIGGRGVLLLGGRGKGLSYEPILGGVSKYARSVVAYGEERKRIAEALGGIVPVTLCEKFREAVRCACTDAREGEWVLLSPACTSYDEFRDFEERGAVFADTVRKFLAENDEK